MSRHDQIDAQSRTLSDVLSGNKYSVDYYQREYRWEPRHVEQLVTDLASTFLASYKSSDPRSAVEHYASYYLGPFVLSSGGSAKSIIDGQQRLTSLTLLLVFLHNLIKDRARAESVEPLIFSEKYGEKSLNIQVSERRRCFESLLASGRYEIRPDDSSSTKTLVERYRDIEEAFPDELRGGALPYFVDWLKHRVVLVEIVAYSEDSAYTIFESMNDRGLNLTSTEMLKGYLLSRIESDSERQLANEFWKDCTAKLLEYGKDEDHKFFQAWFRSQFADTIRQSKAGSANEDFEKIGTRFHSWLRESLGKAGLDSADARRFRDFLFEDMSFYVKAYLQVLDAQRSEKGGWEPVFYHSCWGVAGSLALPLMLAPLSPPDAPNIVREKINTVASFLEAFAVRRAVNFRKFGASSIRYTMYALVKEIRGSDVVTLRDHLSSRLAQMGEGFEAFAQFRLHGMNRYFVKFLLARVTAFLEQHAGMPTSFSTYFVTAGSKPFEVEHIWANRFESHRDEFDQQHEFDLYRNRIGDLILLPQGTNQSLGAMSFADKSRHYLRENILAMSLDSGAYDNNPNLRRCAEKLDLHLSPYVEFRKSSIDERQAMIQKVCETIWSENL